MKIKLAAPLNNELPFLAALASDFTDSDLKSKYADWLDEQGDSVRAKFLRQYLEAYKDLETKMLPDFSSVPAEWARMTGAPILQCLLNESEMLPKAQVRAFCDRVFPLLRPALSIKYDESYEHESKEVPALGATYLFGKPDLPQGTPWPTYGTCLEFFECEIPGDAACCFLGQLNLQDLSQTLAGSSLPSKGLLSFFSHTETEKFGACAVRLIHTNNPGELIRLHPPENTNEDNSEVSTRQVTFEEYLTLPESYDSPWESRLGLDEFGDWGEDLYEKAAESVGANTGLGVLGYLYATSGADPSPDCEHLRLASFRTSVDTGIAHLAISEDDLRAGRLESVKYVWSDWDS